MCTVINQTKGYHLFGRTLDLAYTYGEEVVVTPKGYDFTLAHQAPIKTTVGIMGVAHVVGKTPLYYDAINQCGLCMAALNFPDFAEYHPPMSNKCNIASFELIPWLLGQCRDMDTALSRLQNINITPHAFSPDLPPTPLHWMLSDSQTSVVIESTKTGLHIHPNPTYVMTNAPDFPKQLDSLDRAKRAGDVPGDFSSTARFIRGVNANTHAEGEDTQAGAVCRFFHVMGTVSQPKGCTTDPQGRSVCTQYTSCGDPVAMAYYVTTYVNRQMIKIQTNREDFEGDVLIKYAMNKQK